MLLLVPGLGLPLGWLGHSPLGWCVLVLVLHPRLAGVRRGKGRQSFQGRCGPRPPCSAGMTGTWQRAGVGPLGSPSPPIFRRARGGTLPALGMSAGREGPAGCRWLCSPALTAPSPAGADAGRWRQRWVPLPPVAFPCLPGEEGWKSHRLPLQQLHLLPARHLAPGAAWDALPVSPSAPLPAGGRGGDRLSRQPGNTGETRNKATLDINCLPDGSWQRNGSLPFPACSRSGSACTIALAASRLNQLWSRCWFWHGQETLAKERLLPLHTRSPLASEKENKLSINPSINGEVRWENY